jgi:phosphopantothenoylcysteine decarboxylase / phosphopantothenate---cysteine ligase
MHPSKAIRGRITQLLAGRRILLGISGSIAAIEVPRIVRELLRHGADVTAVMSAEAARLVTPESVEFATGHPPITQLTGQVEHVTALGPGEGQADLYLIAPATANTISKIAHGIDDTPVTSFASIALGGHVPMMIAPAMHAHMGENPAIRENLAKLAEWGVEVIGPTAAEGEDKLASPEEVAARVLHRMARGPWVGRRVVVIGGASREPIDAVRSVTNESSGASAVALATQAYYRGAQVDLWAGALQVPVPSWIPIRRWGSVEDLTALARAQRATLRDSAAVLVPAALADFTLDAHPGKIRSRETSDLTLTLRQAPKVLPELRKLAPPPTRLVAFKLLAGQDRDRLEAEGRRLRDETQADWVVANDVATMGSAETDALVLPPQGPAHWIHAAKPEFAGRLLDELGAESEASPPARKDSPSRRPETHRSPRRSPRRRGR